MKMFAIIAVLLLLAESVMGNQNRKFIVLVQDLVGV